MKTRIIFSLFRKDMLGLDKVGLKIKNRIEKIGAVRYKKFEQ